ncbi:GTPase IMAP family member 7 isoform X2 [Patella vulgata]|nr:GTPase IMAP family member 7 isoform X2 [Patella vulgata]
MAKQIEQLEISRRRAAEDVDQKEVEEMVVYEKQKPVSLLGRIFNKVTLSVFEESKSDRRKRLRRELKESRAHDRRIEDLKKHGVNLLGPHGDVRIALLGKTGIGKSHLGNNLLKMKIFKSNVSFASVTKQCKFEERQLDKNTSLLVIDTPGLFDTKEPNETTSKEIVRSIALAAPGPHIYIFVIGLGRFTPEEVNTVNILQEVFGERVLKHVIVVFTRKDDLDGAPPNEFIENAPSELHDLIKKCGYRFAFINNKADPDTLQEDVDVILDLIFKTIGENQGAYYTNDMYEEAEKIVDGKRKEIQNEKERQQEKLLQEKNEILNAVTKSCGEEMDRRLIKDTQDTEQKLEKKRRELEELEERRRNLEENTKEEVRRLMAFNEEQTRIREQEEIRFREMQKEDSRLKKLEEENKRLQEEARKRKQELAEEEERRKKLEEELQKKVKEDQNSAFSKGLKKIADVENRILENTQINSNRQAKKQVESNDSFLGKIGSSIRQAGAGALDWVKSWWS